MKGQKNLFLMGEKQGLRDRRSLFHTGGERGKGAIKPIILYLEEMGVPRMDTLEEVVKREREEARLEGMKEGRILGKIEGQKVGIQIGKLLERKEFVIRILSKRFGNQLTERLKDEIRNASEKRINNIEDNLLEITIKKLDDIKITNVLDTAEKMLERGKEVAKMEGKIEGFKKGRIEGEEEGIEKGKIEERKECAIRLLSKRFGNQLTEEIKDKIRKTDEKTIDYIGDNLLEITIEELKEILK
jgi:hypothetical protein